MKVTPSGKDYIGKYETFCMDIMVGYIIYDFVFESTSLVASLKYQNGKRTISWSSLQILFHHLLGFASHLSMQLLSCGTGSLYMMGIYGAELSTPFLHGMWFLTDSHLTHTRLYFYCGCTLLGTFFWRNIMGWYIMYHLCTNWPLWVGSTTLNNGGNVDAGMYYAHVGITACFVLLNMLWTYKLVKKAFFPNKKKKAV